METINIYQVSKGEWRACSEYCKEHGHSGMLNKIKRLCDTNGISEMGFYKAHADKIDYSSIRPNTELTKYLIELKNNRVQIVVASNNHLPHLEKVLDKVFGQSSENIFSDIISGHTFQMSDPEGQFHVLKPSRLYFEGVYSMHNKKPQECVFVDDTKMNVNSCEAIGMKGLYLEKQNEIIEELRKILD